MNEVEFAILISKVHYLIQLTMAGQKQRVHLIRPRTSSIQFPSRCYLQQLSVTHIDQLMSHACACVCVRLRVRAYCRMYLYQSVLMLYIYD